MFVSTTTTTRMTTKFLFLSFTLFHDLLTDDIFVLVPPKRKIQTTNERMK